jgi:hypothetical protein
VVSYRVIPAEFQRDRDTILSLWTRNLADKEKLREKLEWHFGKNPSGPGQCWLLEADGEAVGTASLGLRRLKVRDRVITAGVACDLAVERKHRFLQPALMLQKAVIAAMKSSVQVVYGFPGSGGSAVLQRAGYEPICFTERYAKVLRLSPYLQRNRHLAAVPPALKGILDFSYSAISSLRQPLPKDCTTEIFTDFDQRFDELWKRNSHRYPILTVRDSSFLRWRYRDCPLRQYTTIGLLSTDRSRLRGYLIYFVEDRQATCADLFAESADTLCGLISKWFEIARSQSMHAVSIRCCNDRMLLEALHRLRFTRRTAMKDAATKSASVREPSRAVLAYRNGSADLTDSFARWYFTPGDQPYN